MLERDIMNVISEGTIPDTYADAESPYVTLVRENRVDGTDGLRRMQGLLEVDEMELLIEHIHFHMKPPSNNTPGGSPIRSFECGESTVVGSGVESHTMIGARG